MIVWARLRRWLADWLFWTAAKHVVEANRLGALGDETAARVLRLPAQGRADELGRELERIVAFGSGALREAARAQRWLDRATWVGGPGAEPAGRPSIVPLVPLDEGRVGHRPVAAPTGDRVVFH
jgi:hypothetical protein